MIEQYLQILDSLKKELIPQKLYTVRVKILSTLLSDKFSNRITPYFSNRQENGEPFSHFESEPMQIVALKTLINALYHGELAFKDLETMNLRDWRYHVKDSWTFYNHTIGEGYKACYLLTQLITQLESNLIEHFSPEIHQAVNQISQLMPLASGYLDNANLLKNQFQQYPLSYKTGHVCGIAVDQMDTRSGEMDYDFLTQLAATLPADIHRFTSFLQHYSAQFESFQPELDQQKVTQLRFEADSLLNAIENLRSNDFFLPLKALNYIYILRHIINLTVSIWEEMGYMTDSAQVAICEKIGELKYNYLPSLIALVDQTEVYTLLEPGLISGKMINSIESLYITLIDYTGKFVNFTEKRPALLLKLQGSDSDPAFIQARTQKIYQRIAENNHAKSILIKTIRPSFSNFFNILEKPKYKNRRLNELSLTTKQALLRQYKHLQIFVKKIDIKLHNNIILALKQDNNSLEKPWSKIPFTNGATRITNVIPLKEKLAILLVQQSENYKLQIRLDKDLLAYVLNTDLDHLKGLLVIRKEKDLRLAQQNYERNHADDDFTIDAIGGARGDRLIKHTHYSRMISQFRETFLQLLPLLGEPLRAQLMVETKSKIPFPEIENETNVLKEASQILIFKRLFNCFGHLEQIITKIEQLSPSSFESVYIWHLIEAYKHFFTLKNLINELYQDPYLAPFFKDISDKLLTLSQIISNESSAYLIRPNEVNLPQKDSNVEYDSLWYFLQGFLTLPSHLLALKKKRALTKDEQEAIQRKTKAITINIERIIKDSSNYFRLLLHSPSFYCLFKDLKQALNKFTKVTHETVINQLEEINTIYFTRILIEVDTFEFYLGLTPGLLTEPMKTLLDEFYRGLIEPLGLKPQINIALLGNTFSTEQRMTHMSQHLIAAEKRYEKILTISSLMDNCKLLAEMLGVNKKNASPCGKNLLLDQTKQLCTQVTALLATEKIALVPKSILSTTIQTLDEGSQSEPAQLASLWSTSIPTMKASIQGLLNTEAVTIATAKKQIAFLEAKKEQQIREKTGFIDQQTRRSFLKLIKRLTQRHLNLHYLKEEYQGKLQDSLHAESDTIITDAKQVNDIAERLEQLSITKIANFDNQNANDYLQLENFLVQINQFEMYCVKAREAICSKRSIFEDCSTLSKKTALIKQLKEIGLRSELTPHCRIAQIKEILKDKQSARILLAYRNYNSFCFGWLFQKMLLLFASLKLFTTQAEKFCHRLQQAVDKPSTQSLFIKQHGLFKTRVRDYAFSKFEIDEAVPIPLVPH